jgi:type IV secretory pathway VirB10-like protein
MAASESFSSMALEQSRSAVWPLLLALVVGIAIGFGLSLMLLDREQLAQAPEQTTARVVEPVPPQPAPVPAAGAQAAAPTTAAAAAPPTAPVVPDAGQLQSSPAAAAAGGTARSAPAAAEPEAGRITVRSTPSSARVLLDGRDVGQTPTTIRDVSQGTHVVRITRDGYVTQERRVTIARGGAVPTLAVTLPRIPPAPRPRAASIPATAPKMGSLLVDSRPAGANVFVDGKLVGRTPFESGEIAIGEYTVRLEMPGYNRWSTTVRIAGGVRSRVAASLEQ